MRDTDEASPDLSRSRIFDGLADEEMAASTLCASAGRASRSVGVWLSTAPRTAAGTRGRTNAALSVPREVLARLLQHVPVVRTTVCARSHGT
ncbi:MAG: hypothetical protein GEV06_18665 [Luteitalea sp.]|nr:hypothetical protein [Luteitalea sp.]